MSQLSQYWLHPAITQQANQIDGLFNTILIITGIAFVVVETLLVVFMLRYRRRKTDAYGSVIHGNTLLEIVWTLLPAIIFVWIGISSVKLVYAIQTPPPNPMVIHVIGHQWYWEFKYPNGVDITNNLYVPEGKSVQFEITSADVIHGFFIPRLRLQQDALNGRLTQFSMIPDQTGTFMIRCDQYCGLDHATMTAHLIVMKPAAWQAWMQKQITKKV